MFCHLHCVKCSDPEDYCKDSHKEWNKDQAIDFAYNLVNALIASVGGFFGGYYEVEVNLISNELKWKHFGAGEETTYEKVIRNPTATKVLEELNDIDVLNWKAKYVELDVLDGTQWNIESIRNGRNIKKCGSNLYGIFSVYI